MDSRTLFLATRPWSFTMTFSSVTLGTLIAYLAGSFNVGLYMLTLGGMIAFHAATNLINDFYDVKHGVDKMGAPTTKYRPHPVAAGAESPYTIRAWAAVFYVLTLLTGVYLSWARNPWVLVLVGVGVAASVLYTADPVVLKAKGMGEVIVFLMWGPLIPLGSYVVQTGTLSILPVVVSIPIGLFVALVLLANNVRDIEYDGSVETRTVPVMVGRNRGVIIYQSLLLIAYLFVPVFIVAGLLSPWSLLVLLTSPEALRLWKMFQGQIPDNADPRTASLAFKYALAYMASFILQILIPIHIPL
ncbi:MAG: prenyltransferase [Nitrososphaerales archaeon]|nr:prenyltransferase [Nitrososphaerales archaeon]